jgi:branched-chain amino acid transport system substrate-binding protein
MFFMRISGCLVLALFMSCAVSPPAEEPLASADAEEALLTEIRTYLFEEDYRELRTAGKRYLDRFGDSPGSAEVRLMLGQADVELGFFDEAGEVLSPLLEESAPAEVRGEALILSADVHKAKGRFRQSAGALCEALSIDPGDALRMRAESSLREVVDLLPVAELETLRNECASTGGYVIVLEGSLDFARSTGDTAAVRMLEEELGAIKKESPEAQYDLAERVAIPSAVTGDSVAYRIGLLCPLTGRFSPLGEAFVRGASLALKEARKRGIGNLEIVVGDTQANPLVARSSAEHLIERENVAAIVGAILSSPTIAAAQMAQFKSTVLLSPVASEQEIGSIGDWIFQTTADRDAEIVAVARIACKELGYRRIAFLSGNDLHSRHVERLFRDEVERSGSIVCISEFYDEGNTDFHSSIERIRDADPEALFIASDTEDLILILPQFSFYEFGVQLLGTSSWNSKRLLLMAGRDMEGAVFPSTVMQERERERFIAAATAENEPIGEINDFALGGYRGVRIMIESLSRSGSGGEVLRNDLKGTLENRLHPFLDLTADRGIPFYRVRKERLEEFVTLKVDPWR